MNHYYCMPTDIGATTKIINTYKGDYHDRYTINGTPHEFTKKECLFFRARYSKTEICPDYSGANSTKISVESIRNMLTSALCHRVYEMDLTYPLKGNYMDGSMYGPDRDKFIQIGEDIYRCAAKREISCNAGPAIKYNFSRIYKDICNCFNEIIKHNIDFINKYEGIYDLSKSKSKALLSLDNITLTVDRVSRDGFIVLKPVHVYRYDKNSIVRIGVEIVIYENSQAGRSWDQETGYKLKRKSRSLQLMRYHVNWFGRDESFTIFKSQKAKLDQDRDRIRERILEKFKDNDLYNYYGSGTTKEEFFKKLVNQAKIKFSYVADMDICNKAGISDDMHCEGYREDPSAIVIIQSYCCYILVDINESGKVDIDLDGIYAEDDTEDWLNNYEYASTAINNALKQPENRTLKVKVRRADVDYTTREKK